jgi:hypothetical protein
MPLFNIQIEIAPGATYGDVMSIIRRNVSNTDADDNFELAVGDGTRLRDGKEHAVGYWNVIETRDEQLDREIAEGRIRFVPDPNEDGAYIRMPSAENIVVDALRSDWEYEVSNGDTVLGFDDWQAHKIEAEHG